MSIDEQAHWDQRDELTPYVRSDLEAAHDRPIRSLVNSYRRRLAIQEDMARVFAEVDVLLMPTTATVAFGAAGPPPTEIDGREVSPQMCVPFTMFANLCWNPALSVPAGVNSEGLPIGLQIMGIATSTRSRSGSAASSNRRGPGPATPRPDHVRPSRF